MDASAKQQVVERVKQANNILVTVSKDPTVDQLAACIGLTLFLNKLGKHATAVFSGQVPSTIEFLQPEKTISTNTDNLRDFIISLDKDKADKLRYKIEDNFVRIYITPYHTSLNQKDLEFSQGEVNVDLVLALGVTDQSQLDGAITAHGKILHDALVISVGAAETKSKLGQINWLEPAASSLSEMIVSISEAFGSNLLDGQMATAFLTGIVAETDRFGNAKTSPKVMTMAAQLMSSGANQQLIINELAPLPPPPPPEPAAPPVAPAQPKATKAPKPEQLPEEKKPKKDKGTLNVSHDDAKPDDDQEVEINSSEIKIDTEGNLKRASEAVEGRAQITEAIPVESPPPPESPLAPEPAAPPGAPDLSMAAPELDQSSMASAPPPNDLKTINIELPPPAPEPSLPPPESPPAPEPAAPPAATVPPVSATEAGGHHLMAPPPPGAVPFSAAGDDWGQSEPATTDPLSEEDPSGELLGRARSVAPSSQPTTVPPPADQARSAVEQAYQSGGDPSVSVFPPPSPASTPPPQNQSQSSQAAPPPFPPPITLNQGVVIPPPYGQGQPSQGSGQANNI